MTVGAGGARALWRVGHAGDPLGFAPVELYEFSHRFDDLHRRFRTLHFAEEPETALREVLADFRPNLAARQRHLERYGPAGADDFGSEPVTQEWCIENVLAPVRLHSRALIDLTDLPTRRRIEERHAELLLEHGLEHLDLHEITTARRPVTQTIAAQLFDRGAAAVRFPSRIDGGACVALFENRGDAVLSGEPVLLTDPLPDSLITVTVAWALQLEPDSPP